MNRDTLLNIVKTEGRLPIEFVSEDISKCHQEFASFVNTNPQHVLDKVENLSLPSTRDEEISENVLKLITTKLKNLKSFTFKGGKRDQNGGHLQGCITNLPENLHFSQCLTYLDLSFNEIINFPRWIFTLKNLQRLQLNFCSITTLPTEIEKLSYLKELHLNKNSISSVPEELPNLKTLEILKISNNYFERIPDEVLQMRSLVILDLSYNQITGKLIAPTSLLNLEVLKLQSNKIDIIDDAFLEMSCLKCLDLRFNAIRDLSPKLGTQSFILLDGNPIGCQSPERYFEVRDDLYDVPEYKMDSDTSCIKYRSGEGAEYTFPSGIRIVLPKNALGENATIYSEILPESEVNFALDDLDALLSGVLQLSPSGLQFENPVKLSLPYSFERNDQQIREIIVRVMSDDGTTEDLETTTKISPNEDGETYLAETHTMHFSKFAVVARLMEASTVIKEDSEHLLFSPAFPQTKLKFEEGSVDNGTRVTMKVINVDPSLVQEVSESSSATSSCILSVQVSPPETIFRKPVTIRIALPDQLLGTNFDHNDLKLMKCAHNSIEWKDVTSETPLQISTIDVSFKVQSFSKFIIVREIVCGVVRYIYRRLRTYKVQFIAMQKKSLPTQVLTQCVLEKKVSGRIKQLQNSGYESEDAVTEVQEMLEGSSFKIQITGELQLQKFREKLAQRVQEKSLVCRFFSQYPPDKKGFSRFFIEPMEEEKKCQTGFVSFYKVDEERQKVTTISAKEVSTPPRPSSSTKRKINSGRDGDSGDQKDEVITMETDDEEVDEDEFNEENHLGDVPIALQGDALDRILNSSRPPDLDFGALGTGMFREENLRLLANQIGNEWREIGTFLGIPHSRLDQIGSSYPGNLSEQIFRMLKTWSDLHRTDEDSIDQFMEGLSLAGRNDLAHKVKTLHEEGKEGFHNSVKSLRLEQ